MLMIVFKPFSFLLLLFFTLNIVGTVPVQAFVLVPSSSSSNVVVVATTNGMIRTRARTAVPWTQQNMVPGPGPVLSPSALSLLSYQQDQGKITTTKRFPLKLLPTFLHPSSHRYYKNSNSNNNFMIRRYPKSSLRLVVVSEEEKERVDTHTDFDDFDIDSFIQSNMKTQNNNNDETGNDDNDDDHIVDIEDIDTDDPNSKKKTTTESKSTMITFNLNDKYNLVQSITNIFHKTIQLGIIDLQRLRQQQMNKISTYDQEHLKHTMYENGKVISNEFDCKMNMIINTFLNDTMASRTKTHTLAYLDLVEQTRKEKEEKELAKKKLRRRRNKRGSTNDDDDDDDNNIHSYYNNTTGTSSMKYSDNYYEAWGKTNTAWDDWDEWNDWN